MQSFSQKWGIFRCFQLLNICFSDPIFYIKAKGVGMNLISKKNTYPPPVFGRILAPSHSRVKFALIQTSHLASQLDIFLGLSKFSRAYFSHSFVVTILHPDGFTLSTALRVGDVMTHRSGFSNSI